MEAELRLLYRALATLAWVLIAVGWARRRDRRTHVPLVASGIAIDLVLVLLLELQRSVIVGAVTKDWTALQIAHIASSTLAVVLYIPTVWMGVRLLRGTAGPGTRSRHRVVAQAALIARSAGFLCMWSL